MSVPNYYRHGSAGVPLTTLNDAARYVWKYYESGKYSGYKPRGFWDTHDAKVSGVATETRTLRR